jgi:putative transposase
MNTYKRHRFPPDIISYAVWLYYRFNLSHRDIEDLLAERGIIVSREAIRLWCIKFGALYARRLKRRHRGYGETFFIDEVFVKINGKLHYLWRAVDRMVRWLMYSYRVGGMVPQPSGSSSAYYETTVANPGRS